MKSGCSKCNRKSYLTIKKYSLWTAEISDSPTPIGWIYIILKRHVEQFEELTNKELIELKKIIKELKKMLVKSFNPDWFNVMQLGNGGRHLHVHLVPRFEKPIKFDGKTFKDPDYGGMIIDRYKPAKKEFLIKLRDYLKGNL